MHVDRLGLPHNIKYIIRKSQMYVHVAVGLCSRSPQLYTIMRSISLAIQKQYTIIYVHVQCICTLTVPQGKKPASTPPAVAPVETRGTQEQAGETNNNHNIAGIPFTCMVVLLGHNGRNVFPSPILVFYDSSPNSHSWCCKENRT